MKTGGSLLNVRAPAMPPITECELQIFKGKTVPCDLFWKAVSIQRDGCDPATAVSLDCHGAPCHLHVKSLNVIEFHRTWHFRKNLCVVVAVPWRCPRSAMATI